MDDGRTRFAEMRAPIWNIHLMFYRFHSRYHGTNDFCYETWLTQACHIFEKSGIPREKWKDYVLFGDRIDLSLIPRVEDRHNDRASSLGQPCYLFVLPPPQLPDATPDLYNWYQQENVYCWSFDPDGNSILSPEQSRALGLPSFTRDVLFPSACWKPEVYDLIRLWQKAKGFDPTTTDFARSMGYPILEVNAPDTSRFKDVVEGDGDLAVLQPNAQSHEMADPPISIASSLPCSANSDQSAMDVDVEDCRSCLEDLRFETSDTFMEVD
ncbi:hypothetical protein V5O48_008453 [Marasmius crinis-equi]|uniref:Uncharacterized protein n=1 Tax=Marasmius crinis-equi TaxID=585013 RepID=A0ABR3F7T4_9AGAR